MVDPHSAAHAAKEVVQPAAWLAWTILFAPLAAFFAISLGTRKSKPLSAALAVGAMALGLACTLYLLAVVLQGDAETAFQYSVSWIELQGLSLEFGLLINRLALIMSGIVTGVGLMIFIYSIGYMSDDAGFSRYFAFLSLFAFSMLGIVLANNFLTLFMAWELVGASSYLLIGFWYDKPAAADAGKKAFLVNRIADFGFLSGILMLWSLSGDPGTLNFIELEQRLHAMHPAHGLFAPMSIVALLIFCGVLGKSAQFPLHVWLPDAMQGPTPVSALMHAATMVAAGVYMLCRVFFLFAPFPEAMQMIAWIGGFTAIFAASMALVENDIKRILAYSTLSQLGYMVMALGLGGYTAGMYHLSTHAFFKALLFLGAGCVIHAMHSNDIWHMGGLKKAMPFTFATFLVGTLALCGIWPLSGFWSKDEILALAFDRNKALWLIGTVTALMTAFYMGRALCVVFFGETRSHKHHPHEVAPVMYWPLIVLAVLSAIGGFLGLPALLHHHQGVHVEFNKLIAVISSAVAIGGLGLAWKLYGSGTNEDPLITRFRPVAQVLTNKYYIDDLYAWINNNVQQRIAILSFWFEKVIIMGLGVNGVAWVTGTTGKLLTYFQTGRVQSYALTLAAGLGIIIYVGWRCIP
jgi:NADH-quinone oxidoreductase subunit L